jgi:AraC-like DNA-binding protein
MHVAGAVWPYVVIAQRPLHIVHDFQNTTNLPTYCMDLMGRAFVRLLGITPRAYREQISNQQR